MIPSDLDPKIHAGGLLNRMTKQWLSQNYYTYNTLPPGWELRFGLKGRFLQYDSIEHAERKNMKDGVPFGYCHQDWETLKSNLQEGDEIWRFGDGGGEAVYLIRKGKIVTEEYTRSILLPAQNVTAFTKFEHPKPGYYIQLSCH